MSRPPHPAYAVLDAGSRAWWRLVGRPVDTTAAEAWLHAPTSRTSRVDDGWLADWAEGLGGEVLHDVPGAGLVPDLAELDGPGFAAADLHPDVRDFYEHTSQWRMEVWTGWQPPFALGGGVVARLFGRRVGQLALPVRPLDVARGMDSRVTLLTDAGGRQRGAAWLRTLRATGEYVYSGCYSHRRLPGADRASVHVAFPLERGNVQVFLRPHVEAGGALRLESPSGPWGGDGCYVVAESGGRVHASRAPVHETFWVYVDDEGVLRTDHELRMWSAPAVRLHYRLERRPSPRPEGPRARQDGQDRQDRQDRQE